MDVETTNTTSCESSPLRPKMGHHFSDVQLFDNTDFANLKNINNLINNSTNSTPVRRIISSSRASSGVNSDTVYNTPTKSMLDHHLQSPSRSSIRSNTNKQIRHKYLINHHRKLRNQPSKLDMLDSGFTSFPLDPPEPEDISKAEVKDPMILVEDYINENKRLLASKRPKKISVLDFKRSLREQEQFGATSSPSFSAFSSASAIIRAKRQGEGSELDTIGSQNSTVGQRSVWQLLGSTFSSTSTVRDESFGSTGNSQLHDTSPTTTITELDNTNENEKRCVVCEIELEEIPQNSCFKELVCFNCTEQYEHIVTLINSDDTATEDFMDDDDDDDDLTSGEYDNLRPMSLTPEYEQPSSKKHCNVFDNVVDEEAETEDNFTKIYKSLKKIQDDNNKLLIQATRRKRFHNPLLRVTSSSDVLARNFNFNFNETPTGSPLRHPRTIFSVNNLKESFEKFRKLTLKDNNNNLDGDFWIRAKRKFNWYRQNQENIIPEHEEEQEEQYMMWP